MTSDNILLKPYQLSSSVQMKNRVIMAPMTRSKADDNGVPTVGMKNYYVQRADAGLIITEGTIIRPDGKGYDNVPGIYSQAQIDGWREVTEAVHNRGGKIFSQIWHVGRVSHPYFLDQQLPKGPSATTMKERVRRSNGLFYGQSQALSVDEIQSLINDFVVAAENAMLAGFDGVEIHGANGYLIDQFLHYDTNHREDSYGGSPKNMSRFALEIVRSIGDKIGYDKVGIRLSPVGYLNEITPDKRDKDVMQYLLEQLNNLPIAYVHTGAFDDSLSYPELDDLTMTSFIRRYYCGNLIACGGYDINTADSGIINNHYDLVAIGKPFIANPDLMERFVKQKNLVEYDVSMLAEL